MKRSNVRQGLRRLIRELATFGVIGGICLVLDVVFFNTFTFGLHMSPLFAKLTSMLITGTISFVGHRQVTFRHRHRAGAAREITLFVVVTAGSFFLGLLPIWLMHLILGDGVVALNIANFIAIGLSSLVRFLLYKKYVWTAPRPQGANAASMAGATQ